MTFLRLQMKIKGAFTILITLGLFISIVSIVKAQEFEVSQTGIFSPQNKKVLLLKEKSGEREIILFQTNLRVNTDGSPMSYHPDDPRGKVKALNNVCNAIVVRKTNSDKNLCFTDFNQAILVFEQFRDSKYKKIPEGFEITWHNVLPTVSVNGKDVPCVFRSGEYRGYFGSLTSLKNGLKQNKGECDINDQVDPLKVPALVLVGGQNVVKEFGAKVGDLLVAFNPATNIFTSAIIGDVGPKDNLGEGSILLNMRLLGTAIPPKNRAETFKISIDNSQVMIAIIPASRLFMIEGNRPYSEENIKQRIEAWQKNAGFETKEEFISLLKRFQTLLN